jgi:hypothetical protein
METSRVAASGAAKNGYCQGEHIVLDAKLLSFKDVHLSREM